eukprot:GEZU01021793.1.p1 GENE.GEZU01021793.1~~GEZU01021793.1.p1  ORF type:complete len:376 (-),score=62.94 GEZU01021793.1:111-1238(-)
MKTANETELQRVKQITDTLRQKLVNVSNSIQREKDTVESLKRDALQELSNAEQAQISVQKLGSANYVPDWGYTSAYFNQLVVQLEKRMHQIWNQIEDISHTLASQQLATSQYNDMNSGKVLQETLQSQHEIFLAVAAQLANLHEQASNLRERYTKRFVSETETNPFQPEPKPQPAHFHGVHRSISALHHPHHPLGLPSTTPTTTTTSTSATTAPFGTTTAFGQPSTTTTTTSTTTGTTGGFSFGTAPTATTTTTTTGTTGTTTGGFSFGAPATTSSSTTTAAPASTSTGFSFGTAPTTAATTTPASTGGFSFGTPSTPSFGASSTTFGAPSSAGSTFSGFGSTSTAAASSTASVRPLTSSGSKRPSSTSRTSKKK